MSVVRPAGEVAREAIAQGKSGRKDGARHLQQGPVNQLLAVRQTNPGGARRRIQDRAQQTLSHFLIIEGCFTRAGLVWADS